MNIEIIPLEGVQIDGKPIRFGMEKAAVEGLIGPGQQIRKRCYYLDGEMAIDYAADGTMEFIEFLGGMDGALRPTVYGVSVFDADAEEVRALLAQKNGGSADASEQEYAYRFFHISIGIYREITPAEVLEMVEEMKADGIPTDNNSDLEADRRRASHWASIGCGVPGYYQR